MHTQPPMLMHEDYFPFFPSFNHIGKKKNWKRSSFCLIKSMILVSGQSIQAVLWSAQRYKPALSNLTSCCLGWQLEVPKASEEKVKQQQCPKALFINLKTHTKTGFPQAEETHKLSAETNFCLNEKLNSDITFSHKLLLPHTHCN